MEATQKQYFFLTKSERGWKAYRTYRNEYSVEKGSVAKCEYLASLPRIEKEWQEGEERFSTGLIGIGYVKTIQPYDKTKSPFMVVVLDEVIPFELPTITSVNPANKTFKVKVRGMSYNYWWHGSMKRGYATVSDTFSFEEREFEFSFDCEVFNLAKNGTDKSIAQWIELAKLHLSARLVDSYSYVTDVSEQGITFLIDGKNAFDGSKVRIENITLMPIDVSYEHHESYPRLKFVLSKEQIEQATKFEVSDYTAIVTVDLAKFQNNSWMKIISTSKEDVLKWANQVDYFGAKLEHRKYIPTHKMVLQTLGKTFNIEYVRNSYEKYIPISTPEEIKSALTSAMFKLKTY